MAGAGPVLVASSPAGPGLGTCEDGRGQAEARQHYLTSLAAAKEAEDAALTGNSLAFLAYQMVSISTPDVGVATASYETAHRSASPRVQARLLERLAWTYAVAGRAQDTMVALARAEEALHGGDGGPESDWVFWVDETEMQIMAGQCWTELHRPGVGPRNGSGIGSSCGAHR